MTTWLCVPLRFRNVVVAGIDAAGFFSVAAGFATFTGVGFALAGAGAGLAFGTGVFFAGGVGAFFAGVGFFFDLPFFSSDPPSSSFFCASFNFLISLSNSVGSNACLTASVRSFVLNLLASKSRSTAPRSKGRIESGPKKPLPRKYNQR